MLKMQVRFRKYSNICILLQPTAQTGGGSKSLVGFGHYDLTHLNLGTKCTLLLYNANCELSMKQCTRYCGVTKRVK
jgi:hypothetical protein